MNSSSASSSAVFISNIDDYISPSQACVNPLFQNNNNDDTNNKTLVATTTNTNSTALSSSNGSSIDNSSDVVIIRPKVRRRRRKVIANDNNTEDNNNTINDSGDTTSTKDSSSTPVKASIADCLACSGCVTTAETVLMEQQHSLDKLWQAVAANNNDTTTIIVATISPASMADMLRHLGLNHHNNNDDDPQLLLASTLRDICNVSYVLDGNVPLQLSLEESAKYFVQQYHQQQQQRLDGNRSLLPIVSSSCPALVCLVEKTQNFHNAVDHLSTIKSPMALASLYWKQQQLAANANNKIFHVAIMPCHDKKLEASRDDLKSGIDLVLTTQEWYSLLVSKIVQKQENNGSQDTTTMKNNNNDDGDATQQQQQQIRDYLQSLPMASASIIDKETISCVSSNETISSVSSNNNIKNHDNSATTNTATTWITLPNMTTRSDHANNNNYSHDDYYTKDNPWFPLGSGGYAEYIFRYASKQLFQFDIIPTDTSLPWQQVVTTTTTNNNNNGNNNNGTGNKVVVLSQRMKRAERKRDYYQLILYQLSDNTYSMTFDATAKPVLKFAIAYGWQTLQRVLEPFSKTTTPDYDYIEAMACPSGGCLNGGGQIKSSSTSGNSIETPTETRQRVQRTKECFSFVPYQQQQQENNNNNNKDKTDSSLIHTTFHKIQPLQYTLGTTAGVAVQDTQW